MSKDRQNTEKKLLDAVSKIVWKKGFTSLGVNAVANEAGVSKMLIYRYFVSFDGLLKEWTIQHNYWASASEAVLQQIKQHEVSEYPKMLSELFSEQADSLRASFMRREVMRWMLTEENEVNAQVMQDVERTGVEISKAFRAEIDSPRDIEAAVSVLIGGIYYLSLISDRTDQFNGVNLKTDEGWDRVKRSLDVMVQLLFKEIKRRT